ncbi:hypothetical protein L2X98_28745 [Microbacterium elymi]|uniref:Uncharacterized protein n=1 Tax=Microbacterium elymi TaxID=2909587 RepID=A0ABY5NH85_9MICO|nr:hypothetical protein L2X98_28745 [Microbacterium elymi]
MTLDPVAVTAAGWGWRHAGRRRWAVTGLDLDIPAGQRVACWARAVPARAP